MKVLYDYQIFDEQRAGGISRYHANLIEGIRNTSDVESQIALMYSDNIYLKELGYHYRQQFNNEECISRKPFHGRDITFRLLRKLGKNFHDSHYYNALYCREAIQKGNYDLFHPTTCYDIYDDIEIASPIVLTIHDMIFESYPEYFLYLDVINKKKAMTKRAKKIIAVSNYTKQEILKYYDFIKEEDISVIYHGIDLISLSSAEQRSECSLVYVGGRKAYKCFYTLLKAIAIVVKSIPEIELICVGNELDSNEREYLKFLGIERNIHVMSHATDNDLAAIYEKGTALVSTSQIEGFGIPLIEAMNHGLPLLLSDIPVYREIADDSALYFTLQDEQELAERIKWLINNPIEKDKLSNKGKARVTNFTKDSLVRQTLKVYESAV